MPPCRRPRRVPSSRRDEWRAHDAVIVCLVSQRQKPSWCFVVSTMYFMPAAWRRPPSRQRRLGRVEFGRDCRTPRSASAPRADQPISCPSGSRVPVNEHAETHVPAKIEDGRIGVNHGSACDSAPHAVAENTSSRVNTAKLRRRCAFSSVAAPYFNNTLGSCRPNLALGRRCGEWIWQDRSPSPALCLRIVGPFLHVDVEIAAVYRGGRTGRACLISPCQIEKSRCDTPSASG